MDIRCPSCSTLYEFDENLIPDDGIHLRCSACGQAFRVRRAPGGAGTTGWFVRRAMTGEMVAMPDLGDVQKAVVERRFAPGDLLSRSGAHWKRLEEVAELEPFFKVAAETRPRRDTLGGAGTPMVPTPAVVRPDDPVDDPGRTLSMHARAFSVSPMDPGAAVQEHTVSRDRGSGPTRLQRRVATTENGQAVGHATADHPVADASTMESGPVQVSGAPQVAKNQRRSARTPMVGLAGRTDGAILKDDIRRATSEHDVPAPPPPPTTPPNAPAAAVTPGAAPNEAAGPAAAPATAPPPRQDDGWSLGEPDAEPRATAWSIGGVAVGDSGAPDDADLGMSGEWDAAGLRRGPGIARIVGPIALMGVGALLAVVLLRPDLLGLAADAPDADADTTETTALATDGAAVAEGAPSADTADDPGQGSGEGAAIAAAEGSGTEAPDGSGDAPDDDALAAAEANGAAGAEDTAGADDAPADPSPAATTTATAATARPRTAPAATPPPAAPAEPSGYDALMQRGTELLATNPSSALEAFSAAADQTDRAEAHVGVARAYEAMGRHDLAAARYGRATRQNERYQPAWAGLAAARQRTGDTSGAIEAWERVIRIRSTGAAADRARAALAELRGAR